ncbi:hypothetical protein BJ508DRAFT_419436 [Ascobolus immersus RN42]|uniref:PRELI/MSF1 domain-containing protein n=1 Tax=Ascobolus immersus RN42 TaxID=1160509 RepID=A0A3N4HG44_ASCIM|nr:hypothetical protein BJ508DRAFT_419436 [Ascobolus immersus RN42]
MVKFFSSTFTYDYPFATVSLAYHLQLLTRAPASASAAGGPQIITLDTLDTHFDASTKTLRTTRLLLKQSKLPKLLQRFVPGAPESARCYVLETCTVDLHTKTMTTKLRNIDLDGDSTGVGLHEECVYTSAGRKTRVDGEVGFEFNTVDTPVVSKEAKRWGVPKMPSLGLGGVKERGIEMVGITGLKENLFAGRRAMEGVLGSMQRQGLAF